ncbi:MAG: hypothetical protein Q7J54_04850 [Candidatus Woesearchaeota archaeon]|nr:hypothetical protein [Candidatus Woesearchaeota archaeon]
MIEIFSKEGIVIAVVLFVSFFVFHWLFNKPDNSFDKEVEEILKSDKYKVKGRFES